MDRAAFSSKEQSDSSSFRLGDTAIESDYGRDRAQVFSIFAFTTKKHLNVLIPAIFLTIIAGAIKPIITILLGRIFDELISFSSGSINAKELLNSASKWCIALTGLGIATMTFNGLFFCLWLVFGELQARSLRDEAFRCLIRNDIEWYDLRADSVSSLLVRIQTQTRELQTAASQPLGFFIEDTAAALSALGIAFYYSWNLTLVILCFVPITIIAVASLTRKLKPAIEKQKRDLTVATKYCYTAIKEIDIVKVFNGHDTEVEQYTYTIKKTTKSYLVQAKANASQIGVARFMTTAMFMVGFWYGIVLYRKGLDSGSVLTAFYSCLMATQAAEALLPQWLVLTKGMSAGETLKQTLFQSDQVRKTSKIAGTIKPTTLHGDVVFSKVTFSYPSNPCRIALESASVFFPAGEMTFVIGRSGSGKSTLGNLLMDFYQPSSGTILIDGQSIRVLELAWLREKVSYVQQESVLFNETLFRNIAFGRRSHQEVTENEIKIACQVAMLQQTINDFPDGLQTSIGIGGISLSGGQRQRIAIARAQICDAPILILDEATSALDQTCRSVVMEAVRKWRHGRTTIVVTHDISEIRNKDYVYVLDEGKVVQEGYRQQLLEDKKGKFASFESISHEDSKDATSANSATSFSDFPKSASHISSTSYITATSKNQWTQMHHETRNQLQRASRLFSLNEQLSRYGQFSNPRLHRGVRMGSMFANATHVTDTWKTKNLPSLSRPLHSSIAKPLPSLPNQCQARQAYHSDRAMSDDESLKVETTNVRGTYTLKNLSNMDKPWTEVVTPDAANSSANASISSVIGRRSKQRYNSTNKLTSNQDDEASMTRILGTLWPSLSMRDRIALISGFISAFISASATPAFSYVLARLLGTFSLASGQTEAAKTWALAILAIAIADGISSYYMHYLLEYCGQTWISHLRVDALKRILAQPRAWFDKPKNSPGRLSECLDRDAEEMRNIVGRFTGYMFLAGSMVSIAVVWAFIVCWKLTLVSLASGPCMYAFTRAFEIVSGKWEKKLNELGDATSEIFTETFSKIKTVRALSLESHFEDKYSKATADTYQVGLRRALYTSIFFGLSDSTNSFVTALVLYYGAVIATSGAWSINSILQVITLLLFSSGNANAAIAFIPQISSSRTAASQLLHLANMPRTASQESQGNIRLPTPLPIHFNSLSFSYPSQPTLKVLHDISLTIPANTCTALVGPSGSGKSTIASLLLGLLPPTSPPPLPTPSPPPLTFHPNQHPISSLHMPSLRQQLALVPQTPVLFPTTVTANLTYGLPPHSPLRTTHNIQSAARAAGIHDFIRSLPAGYETRVGDGGVGVSGGQAQRLCIARALARRPSVLVLDEPTAALDAESARAVRELIAGLVSGGLGDGYAQRDADRGMAVVLITHSVAMMRAAGKIVVLERGRVVQQGRFDELMACEGGAFQRLVGACGDGECKGKEKGKGTGKGRARARPQEEWV